MTAGAASRRASPPGRQPELWRSPARPQGSTSCLKGAVSGAPGPRPCHTGAVLRTAHPILPIQVLQPVVAWLALPFCRPWTDLRVLKRRVLNLLVEVPAFMVSDEMRADVLVAYSFSGSNCVPGSLDPSSWNAAQMKTLGASSISSHRTSCLSVYQARSPRSRPVASRVS